MHMHMMPGAPDRPPRLADRLDAVRRGRFVGRAAEIAEFRAALLAAEPPFAVLQVYGPGGVGKSSLLREFARAASAAGRLVIELDGRNVEPSPAGFEQALADALERTGHAGAPGWQMPADGVLLVDTYERLSALDHWLRESFLPSLPASCLVVIAGRNQPTTAWRTDLAWAELTRLMPLGNLQPEESRTYLAARGVPAARHPAALAFTRGHPLALALVVDALRQSDDVLTGEQLAEPDIVQALVERLVSDVPSDAHQRALEICTLARSTTESLIEQVLQVPDARDLFAWLRDLPFIEQGPYGVYPHDLARDMLETDLRWRDPVMWRRLSGRIHVALRRAPVRDERDHQRALMDALYAARTQPMMAGFFDWSIGEDAYAAPARPDDLPAILSMVERNEGAAAAAIARHWWERQPDAFHVFRHGDGERFGFLAALALRHAAAGDIAVDPAVGPAFALVESYGPVTPAEDILYFRFWMHRDEYQAVTPAINLTAVTFILRSLTQPGLAWSLVAMADPDFWEPHFSGVNIPRATQADFELRGRRFGVFAHDWRVEPASEWMVARPTPMPFAVAAPDAPAGPPRLSQEEFAAAVRQALRDFTRADRLATNPLLRARLIASERGGSPAVDVLQDAIRTAVASLSVNPRDIRFHRAVWHTYIEPAPTQEQAAELLDIPFNTYRYRLAVAVERITDLLWQREVAPSR
ncbi:MAG: AAA family ATPase [Chloroflexi bacterium]|nr:MAG: AAA family ATPase [Chloroflexota bacterium]